MAIAVGAGALGTAGAGQAQAAASVRANPGLQPAFKPDTTNYVTRCNDRPVSLRVYAPGETVNVDGTAKRSGLSFSTVRLTSGQRVSFTIGAKTYNVRCLPNDFPQFTLRKYGETSGSYMLTTPGAYNTILDGNGVPVWWLKAEEGHGPVDFKRLPDGTFTYYDLTPQLFVGFGTKPEDNWKILDLNGRVSKELRYQGSPTDLHDMQLLPNGNYLLQSYVQRDGVNLRQFGINYATTAMDAGIQEQKPDGTVVWEWNSKDHTSLDEMGRWGRQASLRPLPSGILAIDARHINTLEPTADGNLLISFRHTDAVYKINRTTGAVIWKLGGTKTPQSLTEITGGRSNPDTDFGGQHDVRQLADGTLTVYDNGTQRGRLPRAMSFKLDETARTATLIDSIEDPEAKDSGLVGSSRKLANGNWIINWGGTGLLSETNAAGRPLLRLQWKGQIPYRAEPIEPGVVKAADIQAGMDAQHPRG